MAQADYASFFLDPLLADLSAAPGLFLTAAHDEPALWLLQLILMSTDRNRV
jgi:hypothetical protein